MKSKLITHSVSLLFLFKFLYFIEFILPVLVAYLIKTHAKENWEEDLKLQDEIEHQKRTRLFHYLNRNAYAFTKYC